MIGELLFEDGGTLLLEGGGALLQEDATEEPPGGSVAHAWALGDGGTAWALIDTGTVWGLGDGGTVWALAESSTMPAIADPISMSVGDRRWLTGDFGNLKELQTRDLVTGAVTIAPASGVAVSGATAGPYQIGAWFEAAAAGDYVVTFSGTLADGTVLRRKAALTVE